MELIFIAAASLLALAITSFWLVRFFDPELSKFKGNKFSFSALYLSIGLFAIGFFWIEVETIRIFRLSVVLLLAGAFATTLISNTRQIEQSGLTSIALMVSKEKPVKAFCLPALVCCFVAILFYISAEYIGGERELGAFSYGPSTMKELKSDIRGAEMGFISFPGDPHALVSMASFHNILGEAKPAIECCNEALDIRPEYMYAYAERALAHSINGDFDKATTDIKFAFELEPESHHPYKMQGRIFIKEGNYVDGIKFLSKSLEMNPEDYSAFIDRARAFYTLSQYEDCLADVNEAIKLKPASSYFELGGITCQAQGHYTDSIKYFDKALDKDPDLASVYKHRAISFKNLGIRWAAKSDNDKYEKLRQN